MATIERYFVLVRAPNVDKTVAFLPQPPAPKRLRIAPHNSKKKGKQPVERPCKLPVQQSRVINLVSDSSSDDVQ